jgi:phospholipase/carboxylesterase
LTDNERTVELGGLMTTVVGAADAPLVVVLLHGYSMTPADLAPFAHSMGLPVLFLFPRGPLPSPAGGRAWWDVDSEARNAGMLAGPRDLADEYPAGIGAARNTLEKLLEVVAARYNPARTVIGGFSQGGMLSLDVVLRGSARVDAVVLMSASRIASRDWEPASGRLRGLPVFVSHGITDQDLAFSAGEALRDFVLAGGARVSWVPFESGHEIPLVVWRALRKFLGALLR